MKRVTRFRRWWYLILTRKDYLRRLNACVDIENELRTAAAGRKILDKEDYKRLADKLAGII
jgi:hypothetical protein